MRAKFEKDYNNSTNNMSYWMNKSASLKAKNFTELTNILNSIRDIFEIFEDKGYTLNKLEKLRNIINAVPNR